MVIQFQPTNFKADQKLLDVISGKLEKMSRMHQRALDATVYLKVDKADNKQNKIIEIKINVPESQLFVSEADQTFENALDKAIAGLRNQLERLKGKLEMRESVDINQSLQEP